MWLETDAYIIELLRRNGTFYKVFVPALEFSQVQLTFLLTFSLRNILTKDVFSEGGGGVKRQKALPPSPLRYISSIAGRQRRILHVQRFDSKG